MEERRGRVGGGEGGERERALPPTFLEGDFVIISSSIIVGGNVARYARRERGRSLLCLWQWDLCSSCNGKKSVM